MPNRRAACLPYGHDQHRETTMGKLDGKVALITGGLSGIGRQIAQRFGEEGAQVVVMDARTESRDDGMTGDAFAADLPAGGLFQQGDVTSPDDADRALAATVDAFGELNVLVNNAGAAVGMDPVADADPADWRAMFEVNVIGALLVTQALLPALVASGRGHVVVMGSTAGRIVYEGGGGYTAAKHAAAALTETLRLELNGQPVRVTEIAPGMVRTDEFALNRFHGDEERAAKVYAGVAEPLTADDIADCVAWCVTRPPHVDIDLLVVKPLAQAAQHKVHRSQTP
jgi:NADP-dependent 3-hydroxy acid dehydrogenase YdfG